MLACYTHGLHMTTMLSVPHIHTYIHVCPILEASLCMHLLVIPAAHFLHVRLILF